MVIQYGEDAAWALFGLTNTAVVFGRGKDMRLYEEMSKLIGDIHIERLSHSTGSGGSSRTRSIEQIQVLPPADIRRIPERQALIIADEAAPIIATLHRCIDGKAGRRLLDDQLQLRAEVGRHRSTRPPTGDRTAAAHEWAHAHGYAAGKDPARNGTTEPTSPQAATPADSADPLWSAQ